MGNDPSISFVIMPRLVGQFNEKLKQINTDQLVKIDQIITSEDISYQIMIG